MNNDGLSDIAIILKHKEDKFSARPTLVLLQNNDKSYRLDKVSNLVMPTEYTESGFKIYDTENISIENGILKIQLFGIGPSGNLFSDFKYFGDELLLISIETYNMGAGSHQSLYYDLEKGELTQEIMNTMEDDMPSHSKTYPLNKETYTFENTSPEDIILKVYETLDSEDW